MENIYECGLTKVHVWPITSYADSGEPTYGTVNRVPNAVSIKFNPEGTAEARYGDNVVVFKIKSNKAFTGELEVWNFGNDLRVLMLGEKIDANGALYEDDDIKVPEFAMAFEFEGDNHNVRHLFYRCTVEEALPIEGKTNEDQKDPQTKVLKLTAHRRADTGIAKISLPEGATGYDTFFTTPYEMVPVTVVP